MFVFSLEEDSQLLRLEEELQRLREELQQARNHGNVSVPHIRSYRGEAPPLLGGEAPPLRHQIRKKYVRRSTRDK